MSARLSRDEVARIAGLAHLALTEAEIDLFARQLAGIIAYVDQLAGLETTDVPPASHAAAGGDAPLRPDDPRPGLARADALAAAPEPALADGLFKVPRVLAR